MTAEAVHQICIIDGFGLPSAMPEPIGENIHSFQTLQTGFDHRLWSGEDVRDLIKARFDNDVLKSFDLLLPYSYKCDLARLCVTYIHGGLYADLGMRLVRRFEPPTSMGFAGFRSLSFLTSSWTTVSNGIFLTRPGRAELLESIQAIVRNCRARNYDAGPLYPTGPVLFGRSIAAAMLRSIAAGGVDDQWMGEVRRDPDGSGATHHFARTVQSSPST